MQRQNSTSVIRRSRVLLLSLLVVMFGAPLEPAAADETVSFGAPTEFGAGRSPVSVAVGDFNGDGKLDLAVANLSSETVSILLGTGTGSFGAKTDFDTGSVPRSVAVGGCYARDSPESPHSTRGRSIERSQAKHRLKRKANVFS